MVLSALDNTIRDAFSLCKLLILKGSSLLTDTMLRNIKPRDKQYKVADRDGLYVAVSVTGSISFRYNYRLNSRSETLTFGRHGAGGITLAEARDMLLAAKKKIALGQSPAQEKARSKSKLQAEKRFGVWGQDWLRGHEMAESTRDMRRSVYMRDIKPFYNNRLLHEITEDDVRERADAIVERGAPATAVIAREIIMQIYRWAAARGYKGENPAEGIAPTSIARFKARDRALGPDEIGLLYRYMERVGTTPMIRLGLRLLLLTMVRKSELIEATWDEVSFTDAVWCIPAARMKRRNPHNVYLSTQAMDIFTALKVCAGGSKWVLPGRYDTEICMSKATFNQVTKLIWVAAQADQKHLPQFSPHDFRRTASTQLHEAGYNSDWVEKCLAHEQKGVRGVYNRAEYSEGRRAMLQDWANMIDGWSRSEPSA